MDGIHSIPRASPKGTPRTVDIELTGIGTPGISHISGYPVQTGCINSARTLSQPVSSVRGSSTDSRTLYTHFLSNRGKSVSWQILTTSSMVLPKISRFGYLGCYPSSNTPPLSQRFSYFRLFPDCL